MSAADSKPSVAAYHRQLSSQISSLLRATGSTKPPTVPLATRKARHSATATTTTNTTSSTSVSKISSAQSTDQDRSNASSPDQTQPTSPSHTHVSPPLPSKTPEAKVVNKSALLAQREEEHDKAWKQAGAQLYKALPPTFNLVLDKPSRSGQPSTATTPSSFSPPRQRQGISQATMEKGMKGLGIDLAISDSQDSAIKMGLMVENPWVPNPPSPSKRLSSVPIEVRRLVPRPSRESLSAQSGCSPQQASASSYANGKQHPSSRRRSQESGNGSRMAAALRAEQIQASSRDVKETEDEKFEEYERRREMRLKKRFAELDARVCQWREAVPPVSTIEFPEIEPTPPTPSIASGMLRLSPFFPRPTSLPFGSAPSAPDAGVRFRALDALLGDMSLVHPSSSSPIIPLPTKPQLHPSSVVLKPLTPMDPLPGLEKILGWSAERSPSVNEGLPTPKAGLVSGVFSCP
ncbi:hypothetical protein DB88DRAFT_209006 [Papiliotrema laurentii]|uniref:Uncharacterized protein n=1 Tax=Papiliotrema laurentii TaxID=5418 RepID=A0AAD9FT68_PAPLA|nr:hypothetical protein DB88DRAFT_209006 [Papiliotrema laurentii]